MEAVARVGEFRILIYEAVRAVPLVVGLGDHVAGEAHAFVEPAVRERLLLVDGGVEVGLLSAYLALLQSVTFSMFLDTNQYGP